MPPQSLHNEAYALTQQIQGVHGPGRKCELQDGPADDVGLGQGVRQCQDDLADLQCCETREDTTQLIGQKAHTAFATHSTERQQSTRRPWQTDIRAAAQACLRTCADAAVRKASKRVPPSNSAHFRAASLPVTGIGGWLHLRRPADQSQCRTASAAPVQRQADRVY